jgi:hypothetical protein
MFSASYCSSWQIPKFYNGEDAILEERLHRQIKSPWSLYRHPQVAPSHDFPQKIRKGWIEERKYVAAKITEESNFSQENF